MNVIHYGLGQITWEQVDDLIKVVNQLNVPCEYVLKVHLRSSGGYADARDTMVDILNDYNHQIRLVYAESAAFELLYLLKGKIHIPEWAYGMYHSGTISIKYKDGMKKTNHSVIREHMCNYEYSRSQEVIEELGFTDREVLDFLDEKDVYFNSERLKEMFRYKLLSGDETGSHALLSRG